MGTRHPATTPSIASRGRARARARTWTILSAGAVLLAACGGTAGGDAGGVADGGEAVDEPPATLAAGEGPDTG